MIETIAGQVRIGLVKAQLRAFEDKGFAAVLSDLTRWSTPPAPPSDNGTEGTGSSSGSDSGNTEGVREDNPTQTIISRNQIKVSFDKAMLVDESDVDRYLQSMKEALLNEIQQGKRVQV